MVWIICFCIRHAHRFHCSHLITLRNIALSEIKIKFKPNGVASSLIHRHKFRLSLDVTLLIYWHEFSLHLALSSLIHWHLCHAVKRKAFYHKSKQSSIAAVVSPTFITVLPKKVTISNFEFIYSFTWVMKHNLFPYIQARNLSLVCFYYHYKHIFISLLYVLEFLDKLFLY